MSVISIVSITAKGGFFIIMSFEKASKEIFLPCITILTKEPLF